jgi:hypothetical protein
MLTIDTEHGPATLWWDDESDPSNPGWVLRYHLEPEGSPDALGRRHLDEPLDVDGDEDAARRVALEHLADLGIGAGRRLTSADAAEVAGLGSAASWRNRAREWGVAPDGHYDARTPWWWQTTVTLARRSRPGQGARTDLRG